MADEQTSNDQQSAENAPQSQATVAESQPQSPSLTPEQVQQMIDAAVKKARDSAFADARRTFENKPKAETPKPKQESSPSGMSPEDVQSMMRRQSAYDRTIAKLGLNDDQVAVLDQLYAVEKPDSPSEWLMARAKVFGTTQAQPAAAAANAAPATSAQSPAPTPQPVPTPRPAVAQSDAGAPQGLPVWDRPGSPFAWTDDDISRLEALKGKREAQRIIRRKAEEYARGIRLTLPTPGRR